ncbi:MAG: hypothetical protein H6993_12775 [Pseudomonadales bacterium]|nr:hypothetical protein [Pseudomonadales bacterium]MCP5184832.1 hypothetical protein [Pseudomonadales bacterium]
MKAKIVGLAAMVFALILGSVPAFAQPVTAQYLRNSSWQEDMACRSVERFGFLMNDQVREGTDIFDYTIVTGGDQVVFSRNGNSVLLQVQVINDSSMMVTLGGVTGMLYRCGNATSANFQAPVFPQQTQPSAAPQPAQGGLNPTAAGTVLGASQLGANCAQFLTPSEQTTGDVSVKFSNKRNDDVFIGWVDFSGNVNVLGLLTSGNSYKDNSHPQHRYVVFDGSMNCVTGVRLGIFDEHVKIR